MHTTIIFFIWAGIIATPLTVINLFFLIVVVVVVVAPPFAWLAPPFQL